MKHFPILLLAITFATSTAAFADGPELAQIKTRDEAETFVSGLHYQTGRIVLNGGLAVINVPAGFRYLSGMEAEAVLVRLWHNPPESEPMGMLLPEDMTPLDQDCWATVISYVEEGHVKDDDAAKINYDTLLDEMKKGAADSNKERTEKGYPTIELIGWAAPPRYDAATHKMYWAKEFSFNSNPDHTLNYDIRVLGRKGILVLNTIAPMARLPEIEKSAPSILAMVDFQNGNRYADYDSSTDKLATYGLAALVLGGVAAKAGLFKVILVGLLAAKKFIIIGAAAVSGWFKKIFKKKDKNPQGGAVS